MLAIWSHRPSRLSCIFGFGAALVLAGSALTTPPPARAVASESLSVDAGLGQVPVAGALYSFWVTAWTPGGEIDTCYNHKVHFSYTDAATALPADYTFQNPFATCTLGDLGTHDFTFIPITAGTQTITVSDIGDPAVASGYLTFDVAPGPASSLTVSGLSANVVQGAGTPFRVTLKDPWNNVATNYTGTVNFTSSDGSATLPGSYTFSAGDAGTGLFTVNFGSTGSQSVTATDAASASLHASASTNVLPHGDWDHLAVSPREATIAAGGSQAYTARGVDAYGNSWDVTSDTTFTIDSGTLCPAHSCTSTVAGTHTVTGKDGWQVSTATLHVTAGSATHLSVGTFNPYPAGVSHSVTVKALDAYGNTATGYTGSIHFTSSDTHAVLPADYTFTSADKGVHTFTGGLTLKTAGSRWVRATDKTTASITGSQTVTVTPGVAKTLSVGTFNPYPAGVSHSVTVKALDAYGNVATGYTGSIHFTSSDTHATVPADYTFTSADKGVHTFTGGLTLKTAGSQWVRATDKTTASITGSQTVTVT